jgi:hypothetical protein
VHLRRTATIVAALGLPGAAIFLGIGAVRDRGALDRATAARVQVESELAAGHVAEALTALRTTVADATPVLEGNGFMHAWTRMFRGAEVDEARRDLARCVTAVGHAVEERAARQAALRVMRNEVDRVGTIAALDAIEARRSAASAQMIQDAPEAHAELVDRLAARRSGFEADVARNRAALRDFEALHRRAVEAADAAMLFQVIDAVLPVPARSDEDVALRALHESARASVCAALQAGTFRAAREAAAAAATSEDARATLRTLLDSPAAARIPSDECTRSLERLREEMLARINALGAWEAAVQGYGAALAAQRPAAAALALARIEPCDARTAARLAAMRQSAPGDIVNAFSAAAVAMLERDDWEQIAMLADSLCPGTAAWNALDPTARAPIALSLEQLRRRVDRGLYEQFMRRPCVELADRYLRAWPSTPRRMAPMVLAWRTAALGGRTALTLESARWGATGVESPTTTLEDRPDATIDVRASGESVMRVVAVDISEDTTSTFDPAPRFETGAATGDELRIACAARIDLRDALAADPIALGGLAATIGEWRALRQADITVTDPAYPGRPHRIRFRVTMPDAPALPPFTAGR